MVKGFALAVFGPFYWLPATLRILNNQRRNSRTRKD